MSHEIIRNEPVLFEPIPLEPKVSLDPNIIFLVQNGTGNEEERNEPVLFEPISLEPKVIFLVQNGASVEERVVTLSDWKDSVKSAKDGLNKLQRDLAQIKERTQKMQRGKTTRRKPYSSTEKKQNFGRNRKDRERVNDALEQNRKSRRILAEQGKWLLLSPSEEPLKVRLRTDKQGEIVSGNPLDSEEAAWRMFVFNESEALWTHPRIGMLKEYFFLRQAASLMTEGEQEIEKKLAEFRNKASRLIPPDEQDELAGVFSRITNLDFRQPPLPGLEALLKAG